MPCASRMLLVGVMVVVLGFNPCSARSKMDSPAWQDGLRMEKRTEQNNIEAYLQKYGVERMHASPLYQEEEEDGDAYGDLHFLGGDQKMSISTGTSSSSSVDPFVDIHLCAHTHDDVGWISTVSAYYNHSVHDILTSVVEALTNDPTRRFIWSEIKWIEMWWPQQSLAMQSAFRKLVQNGQLEFVGAGWSQTDEVSPSYRDMIDNAMTGHEYLRRILGDACPAGRCVRFGWQIDMFSGYSGTTPTLWAMMGYDGMVIRFEGPDDMRAQFGDEKAFQFLWVGGNTLSGNRSEILTHVLRWNYGDLMDTCRPPGCTDPSIAPTVSFGFSSWVLTSQAMVEIYAAALVAWVRVSNTVYPSPSYLAVWGGDFQFTNASMWFDQMDLIIHEIRSNPAKYNATIRYSTLSNYFDQLHARSLKFPVKENLDFEFGWPHRWLMGSTGNDTTQYQTGAPSSRAAHKQHIRHSARITRAAQFLHAYGLAEHSLMVNRGDDFMVAWDANGVCSHHDSVPGTMQSSVSTVGCPHVMAAINAIDHCTRCSDPDCRVLEDYTSRLDEAEVAISDILADSMKIIARTEDTPSLSPRTDHNTVIIYNPLPHDRKELVNVSFTRPGATLISPTVFDSGMQPVMAQIGVNDTLLASQYACTVSCPDVYTASKYEDTVFFLASVPALGFATYFLRFDPSVNSSTTVFPSIKKLSAANNVISNSLMSVQFDPKTGLMERVTLRDENRSTFKATQTYWNYLDGQGGAYCIVEQSPAVRITSAIRSSLVIGPVFEQVSQTYAYGKGLLQRYRLVQNEASHAVLQVHHVVGTLSGNRELVSRIETDLDTAGHMYTDASGFWELRDRVFNTTGPIAQNYYALVQTAMLQDRTGIHARAMAVLTKRTMGVANLVAGGIEYMLLRRIVQGSDFQGPAPLDESDPIEDSLHLMFGSTTAVEAARFPRALELEHPLIPFYTTGAPSVLAWEPIVSQPDTLYMDLLVRHSVSQASSSNPALAEFALRLQSFALSPVNVSLGSILHNLQVVSCEEMTLTFLQTRASNNASRLVWSSQQPRQPGRATDAKENGSDTQSTRGRSHYRVGNGALTACPDIVSLDPLDIRSFAVQFQ